MNTKLRLAMIAAALMVAPLGIASAQTSCEEYMAVVKEKWDRADETERAKATEHFEKAQQEQANNNEEGCIEALQLANEELDRIL
jgi:hypothetical protein